MILNCLSNVVLTDDFLHFGEGGVTCERNLVSQLLDCVRVKLALGCDLLPHFGNLFLFGANSLILNIKHVLKSFYCLVCCIHHLLVLLLLGIRGLGTVLCNCIFEYFIL